MRLELDKQYGQALINLLRQAAMTSVNVVRPIAFAVGANSNVLDTCDAMIEDMTAFIHNVTVPDYYMNNDESKTDKPIVFKSSITTGLDTSQFDKVGILSHDNMTIANILSPTNVCVIFRNSHGKYSAKENIQYLRNNGIDTDFLAVIPSRHCAVDSFTLKEIQSENSYVVDINIESKVASKDAILQSAIAAVSQSVAGLSQKLQNS